jgi:hypothetical protein
LLEGAEEGLCFGLEGGAAGLPGLDCQLAGQPGQRLALQGGLVLSERILPVDQLPLDQLLNKLTHNQLDPTPPLQVRPIKISNHG